MTAWMCQFVPISSSLYFLATECMQHAIQCHFKYVCVLNIGAVPHSVSLDQDPPTILILDLKIWTYLCDCHAHEQTAIARTLMATITMCQAVRLQHHLWL